MVIESDFYITITKSLNENKHNDVEIISLIIITKNLGSQRIGQILRVNYTIPQNQIFNFNSIH